MDLERTLRERQSAIAEEWAGAILRAYPEEGAKFFGSVHNRFANPAGYTFRTNTERILANLFQGGREAECAKDLDGILRIRAVQGLSPSVALSFIPALKEILYRELCSVTGPEQADALLHDWYVRIDRLLLMGFDIYMNCRETLWQQKANQLYDRTHKLLEKANLIQKEDVTG
ncbi:hypothetical protein TDMWS_09140 [Thermodesulfomicrobium sp. WS]|uniref:RsbRD N-terminal domain-containing protein n=1 Tax=Thermodesulfomicrobium sp. WS TaxID=3004129 RepID=UPI00248FB315|nr:RsbRD N-terminal domain-containing protein [Thermodesulfomicrobium sp. WS]BDV00829.1 hypothetical protein TDMWS_09140 [Thermodesulfomicrobium sp. WS]